MMLRVGLTALGWIGFMVVAFLFTTRGFGYSDVHWSLATPHLFEAPASGVSERITPQRPAALKPQPAAGRSASPQPGPKRAGTRQAGPARPASKPSAPLQLRWHANPTALKAFSPETHYLSLPAYVRYVVHERTGRWITLDEAAKMVREKTIPIEAAAVNP